jgi:hypothetical protein
LLHDDVRLQVRILAGRAWGCLTAGPVRLTDWPDDERGALFTGLSLASAPSGRLTIFTGSGRSVKDAIHADK